MKRRSSLYRSWTCLLGVGAVPLALSLGCSELESTDPSAATHEIHATIKAAAPTPAASRRLCEYAVYSTQQSQVRDRVQVKGGIVGSSGQTVELGADSRVDGGAESVRNVFLRSRAYVSGDVVAGGDVTKQDGVVVTGTIQSHATVTPTSIPPRSFACTSTGWTVVESGQTLNLSAGSYGNVVVRAGGKLTLGRNAYTFNSLRFESGGGAQHGTLDINAPEGLDVQVCGELYFGNFLKVNLIGETSPGSLTFYSKSTGTVTVGTDTAVYGTITAPQANVQVYSRTTVAGSLYGKEVWIEPDTSVQGRGCCPVAHDWSRFHRDNLGRGYTPSYAPTTNKLLWKFPTGSNVEASPAVVGNKVFVGDLNGTMYALDRYTGAQIWAASLGGSLHSSPAVAGGKVYVVSHPGHAFALNQQTGDVVWDYEFNGGHWDWSSPAVNGNQVFFAGSTGYVYALNSATGSLNWSAWVGGEANSAITVYNRRVYTGTHNLYGSWSPTLVALDEFTGATVWTYDYYLTHGGVAGMVSPNGATIVQLPSRTEVCMAVYNWEGVSNQLVCLNERTGAELWSQSLEGNSVSAAAVHNGVIFVGSDANKVFAVNAATGSVLWTQTAGAEVWAAPAVSGNGEVCYGSLDHKVYCVKESSGEIIWSYDTSSSRLYSSPAISGGVLFIGNENGNVYAFGEGC